VDLGVNFGVNIGVKRDFNIGAKIGVNISIKEEEFGTFFTIRESAAYDDKRENG